MSNLKQQISGPAGSRWGAPVAWCLVALGTLAPLFWYWMQGLTLVHRDQPSYFAPLRWIAGQALREGRLPLWNPYNATGMPYLALMTHGALHPFSIISALLFPADGLDPLMGLYILAAGLGAAIFARTLGASLAASMLAGFAYGLSGYMLSTTSNINNLTGTASLPWIPLALRLVARDRSALTMAGAALAVACCALCGDIQELMVATLLGLALAADIAGRRGLYLALAATALGGLLGAIQLVPSWSFLPLTNRILPLPAYDVNQWDLELWRLVEFLVPGFFWLPSEGTAIAPVYQALGHPTTFQIPYSESVYVGVATLLLAAVAIPKSRTTKLLALSALVVLWFSLGRYLGARTLQNLVPLAKGFRYGEKFLPGFLLCLSALAALGADLLCRDSAAARRWAMRSGWFALALGALWLVLETGWALGLFERFDQGRTILGHLLQGMPHPFICACALAGSLLLAARGKSTWALGALTALTWCSLAAAVPFGLRPGHPEARIKPAPPPLTAEAPGPRTLLVQPPLSRPPQRADWNQTDQFVFDFAASLAPNTNAWHKLDSFGVDSGFFPLRWFMLFESSREQVALVARRFGVTHLLFPPPRQERGRRIVALVTSGGTRQGSDARTGMEIWTVPHRPWASFAKEVVAVPDAQSALGAVLKDGANLGVTFVEGAELPAAPGQVISLKRGLEDLEIVAQSSGDATLVVNDAYWPGWRATIDGQPTPIYPADSLVRAVRWPAGRHTLTMVYDPPEVKLGASLSLAGLLALGGACYLLRRQEARDAHE